MAGVPVAFSEVLNVSGVVQFLFFGGCFDVFVFLCVCAKMRGCSLIILKSDMLIVLHKRRVAVYFYLLVGK